jgi:hypothetical protein
MVDKRMAELVGTLAWPTWFCDETTLRKHIDEKLGLAADLDTDAGFAGGECISVAGSNRRFQLVLFVRPAGRGGWQATDRLLIPETD